MCVTIEIRTYIRTSVPSKQSTEKVNETHSQTHSSKGGIQFPKKERFYLSLTRGKQ